MSEDIVSTEGSQEREFMGHPIGLSICFLTEMWERFSFYGMRALLILYLTKHFLFSTGEAGLIYGAYTGLVYLLPILGGYFADRYLGSRKAVVYGGLLLVIGHISLAFEGPPAEVIDGVVSRSEDHVSIFFFSLALIVTGVGFLKANISTIVGALYGPHDPRRDGGFTIFYMGINVGSFLATLIVAGVGEVYGWGYGFGLAGFGMLLGLAVFLWGQHLLDGRADPPNPTELKEKVVAGILDREQIIYIVGFGLVALMWFMMQFQELVGQMLDGTGILMLLVLLAYGFMKCTSEEKERLVVMVILILFMSMFWVLFEQQGASLTLIADQVIDRDVMGVTVTAGQVQTLNPFFIVVLAPLFAMMWTKMGNKGIEPSTPAKFALALIIVGAGYLLFVWGMGLENGDKRGFIWMVEIYFFLTAAELCLSPVGLSMVTKLAPARVVGMAMGTFFLFIAIGNYKAGYLSSLMGAGGHGGGALDMEVTMDLFAKAGGASVGIGILLLILTPWLRKRMHGIH